MSQIFGIDHSSQIISRLENRLTVSHERLLEVLSYDAETGEFRWIYPINSRIKVGGLTGVGKPDDYGYIRLDRVSYLAHRLAWFYVHAVWPYEIDHVNRVKNDNRIANLRVATKAQNGANRGLRSDNTSGVKGVYWNKGTKRWVAQISWLGKLRHLGSFIDKQEAAAAYKSKADEMYGEFARAE